MGPLAKTTNITRIGLPKNTILERAEIMAESKLSLAWRLLPTVVAVFFFGSNIVLWFYSSVIFSAPLFSVVPLLVLALGFAILVPVYALFSRFISSYIEILRTSRAMYFQDQMFSLIIEGANDGIWDWDVVANKIFFSPRWNEMFGYRKNEMSENPNDWFALIHPEDAPLVEQHIKLHFEKKEAVFHVEHRIKTVSGDYKWVLDRGHAVWDQRGKVLRFSGSTTDIGNLKEVEEVLQGKTEELERANDIVKQEKVKYAALLTSIGDGMIATDKDGLIMVMNPQAAQMLGRDIGSSVGRLFVDVVTLEQDQKEKQVLFNDRPVVQTLLQGSRITTVSYYFKPNGEKFPVSVTSAPVMLEKRVIGAVVVFRDITKEIAIDKSKTEFVSLASHQLRTPLSAIRWYSEMLKSERLGPMTDAQKSYLEEIYTSNRRMIELVNSLLNVSRIDLGTFAIEPVPTDFKEISESVLRELFVKIQETEMHVTSEYQDGLPKINADPKLMRIIFQNLLSNSVKYTKKGGNVSLSITFDSKNMLIKVSDDGVGIPSAVQDRVFTKLFRADNARIVESEGTGLGLYVIKAVVEKSGGRIWFKSEENVGTTFFVELPLAGMSALQGSKDLV